MEEKRARALRLLDNRAESSSDESDCAPSTAAAPPLDQIPAYLALKQRLGYFDRFGLDNPFRRTHEDLSANRTTVNGRSCINFSGYNYLGLSGHPEVSAAARNAIDRYGTSASASRLAGGQIPLHLELEHEIAQTLGVEQCVTFASGYSTNVTTLGHLFGPKDLVVHDSLIHRSILTGCQLAGARRLRFPHNDWQALDRILSEQRRNFRYAAVLIEGVYSMDGDIADLPKFIAVKKRHKAFLMVDEAHSFGVLGPRGFGVIDHFDLKPNDVEIWMGTLSKALASSGGYIAGKAGMVEYLRLTAPGFVFAAAMSPPNTAAALTAVRVLKSEPQRVARLHERSQLFLDLAKTHDLATGTSGGSPIVPVITGDSELAVRLSDELFKQGIVAQPIVHPAVEHSAARLRFFVNALHTEQEIRTTVEATAMSMLRLRQSPL
ncbi:MAG TPA: aminotransferase class I/II-fold pyridoxal phosphate-dependent enzyme [Candidatus Binataceae bacterium]|nr:aminotransferase class I/II-fold pyridoxal phosphate-dependent enzyme [Candidatus Binataceae bacterium]